MESVNFNYSLKNIPIPNNTENMNSTHKKCYGKIVKNINNKEQNP